MLQLVKAAVAGLVLVDAGSAAGGEGMSAWDVATGVDGHFPTLNKHAHTAALSQGTKRTHHARVHHHKGNKRVAVHRRQHRRASKHATKHHSTHVHLRAKKGAKNGHRRTAHKHSVKHGRHRAAGTTTTTALQEAEDETEAPVQPTEVAASPSQEPVAKPAPIVAVAPAVHVAVQTKQQLVSKRQTRDDDEDDKDEKKDDEDAKDNKKDDDIKKVRYGPNDCVSTWRNSQGRCMMQTDCKEEDVQRYEFSVVCIDQGGAEVRHIFGEDSFDTQETFDTLLVCTDCQGWPRPTPTTTVAPKVEDAPKKAEDATADSGEDTPKSEDATGEDAPVQLHAKANDDVVKKAEDAAGKVEVSTAEAVQQLVGQVKELKEQLKVAAKEVNVLNEKVGITGTKEEAAPALSQNVAPTTTAPMTVIFQSQLKTAKLDNAAKAHPPKRSLRAKQSTHLKQQAADDEDSVAEDSEENAAAAGNSETPTDDADDFDQKTETSHTDANDDAGEGEEVD